MPPLEQDWEADDDDEASEGPDAYSGVDDAEELASAPTEGLANPPLAMHSPSVMRGILQSLFEMQRASGTATGGAAVRGMNLLELSRMLGGATAFGGASDSIPVDDDDDDSDFVDEVEEEEEQPYYYTTRYRQAPKHWVAPVAEPQEAGEKLLRGGEFGRTEQRIGQNPAKVNVSKFLRDRGARSRPSNHKEDIASHLVPNTNGTEVASSEANIYSGQYSADASFYYTCDQDFKLQVYDTSTPPLPLGPSHPTTRNSALKVLKTIQGSPGRWTITDSHLSPDNERMIYSSITPTVYMTSTLDASPTQIPIRFADPPRRSRAVWGFDEETFGLYSCRFSADGNEIVAGGSGKIFVYDLLADRRTVKIAAHNDDVNSCCWADTASGNILVSASDDSFIKIWDRRSLGSSQKPSGVLVGHTEGITNVAAKGDGRYIISNGKDQALRLWDLRKMHSSEDFDKFADKFYGLSHFDYRYGYYPKPKRLAHPKDCSVMTYRGHQVLQTLIRCHFSPGDTTGGQYLYSGSADGKIHVWSLDGRVVQVLDRSLSHSMSFDPSAPEPEPLAGGRHRVCVRDVSWHSQEPVIMSVAWESGRGGSTVARHEWKGLSKMKHKLEDWVEKERAESGERRRHPLTRHVPGAFTDDEDEDDMH
ncbi:hypothetical protein HWV62_18770 [Athelia sp. TMB]|nr:hypothetical protein HWV62_18770 [Athelia sp. TMB]